MTVKDEISRFLSTNNDGTATPETPPDHKLSRRASIGYLASSFEGKLDQRQLVVETLKKQKWIPEHKVREEVEKYYAIGIDDLYFSETSVDTIASHILSFYGAKCSAAAKPDEDGLDVSMTVEMQDHAVYIDTSFPGVSDPDGHSLEGRLEKQYLNYKPGPVYRVESFRSQMAGVGKEGQELRSHFVNQCQFLKENPTPDEAADLNVVSDKTFLEKTTKNTKIIYHNMIKAVLPRTGPVIDRYEIEGTGEWRIVIGLKRGTCDGYFSAITALYHFYGMSSPRKYVEQFSNGVAVMSVYLKAGPRLRMDMKDAVYQMLREASLLSCIPNNIFHDQFVNGHLSIQQSVYAHCVSIFITHFLNRLGSEYTTLRQQLDPSNSLHRQLLAKLKTRLRGETYTHNDIIKSINQNPEVIKVLYRQFSDVHRIVPATNGGADISRPASTNTDHKPPTSQSKTKKVPVKTMSHDELVDFIAKQTSNEHQLRILTGFVTFNEHVLKTNFYQPTKSALSFRFDPKFLPEEEYPRKLFAMFLVVGAEFRGFHLRFKNVARGGIRIVTSRSSEAYAFNVRSLFDENYALASTQQRKNKDIPEGGAKGVILLNANAQHRGETSFHKYVDSLIDLLLEGHTPNIKDKIVDLYGEDETLYCGPDEGTAGMVDWATQHAKTRGAPWWKSFFTGKSKSLGGIPHDLYGMTSLSVRQYLTQTYDRLGLDESAMTKVQTGGPDGDLGSNEILLGNEKYVAIIDGSGVLYDPAGLSKTELMRLAKIRKMISEYDVSTLSSKGYRVLVDETDKVLPDGEVVARGIDFRNTAHLRNFGAGPEGRSADVLSPQGGRPEAINISNVGQLIENGAPKYSYIIEGANLFITQDARLELEKAGCVVFKDASTNKGGVTSSSLEVLAALSFDDAGFIENMCVRDGKEPAFYSAYVKQIQEIIKSNARMEFDAIWAEHERTGTPRSVLSDSLSQAIVDLQDELQFSSLYDKTTLRDRVLSEAIPRLLIDSIGFETLLARIDEAYLRALFGSFLASRFIYKYGTTASQFSMYEFISAYEQ